MPKYRMTLCQDEGFSKGMSFFCPIDLRKKYYFCHNCQKEHLTKEGVVLQKNNEMILMQRERGMREEDNPIYTRWINPDNMVWEKREWGWKYLGISESKSPIHILDMLSNDCDHPMDIVADELNRLEDEKK